MIKRYFQYNDGTYFTAAFETQEEANSFPLPDEAVELNEPPPEPEPEPEPEPISATEKLVAFLNANSDVKALLGL